MTSSSDKAVVEVVLLCTANRARSPLAEALLARRIAGLPVRVRSRGTTAVASVPALPEMIAVAHELGVDLRNHRSQGLIRGELDGADLVIGFEPFHAAAAVIEGGADRGVVFTLPELVGLLDATGRDHGTDLRSRVSRALMSAHRRRRISDPFRAPSIDDPAGRSARTFTRVAREIEGAVDRLASSLFG